MFRENYGFCFSLIFFASVFCLFSSRAFAQGNELEFTLDAASATIPLPKIFSPAIDVSGRGFNADFTWPQEIAAPQVIEAWQKDIGFNGIYRLQYNLWEISQLAKDKEAQDKLLANYEAVIKKISDAGGTVILDIFSTPAGLGKVLDKKSAPLDFKTFKELIKSHIRQLSCNKKYTIWYEVWSAPDTDAFFLGRKQEYLALYKAVADAVKELEDETKIEIPVGGPSVTWWYQNFEGNSVVNPEGSLIYELIKFCSHNKLQLDFITWHAYSTDPKAEKESTLYNRPLATLIREWLSYFNFNKNTPLIVDEWNYDSGSNMSSARKEASFISASYIPSRLKNMYEAAIDYQVYFSLEDFQGNKEGVKRNVGVFWFEPDPQAYKGGPKASYSLFKMLTRLKEGLFTQLQKTEDEFVDIIATKTKDEYVLLFYNYIDPAIFMNYITRNLSTLNSAEREMLLKLVKADTLEKIKAKTESIGGLRLGDKLDTLIKKAQELHDRAIRFMYASRPLTLKIKNVKGIYSYQRYAIDSSCSINCELALLEQKEISIQDFYQETIAMHPYSVQLIVLKKKPQEAVPAPPEVVQTPQPTQSSLSAQPQLQTPQALIQDPSAKSAPHAPVTAPANAQEPASASGTGKPKE